MKKIAFLLIFANFIFAKGFVVLDPACVEIFYMLGAENQISAIAKSTSSEIYPKDKTSKLPSVGTYIKPNLEKIVELQPEHVIYSFHSSGVGADLDRFDIKHSEIGANKLSDIYQNIELIGKLTKRQNEALNLISELKQRLNSLDLSKLEGKKVIFFYATTNLISFGKGTLPNDIFEFMRLDNIASHLEGMTPTITSEFLLQENPDFILFVGKSVDDLIKQNPILRHTNAYKNNKIFAATSASVFRGTPRIVGEIEKIYENFTK